MWSDSTSLSGVCQGCQTCSRCSINTGYGYSYSSQTCLAGPLVLRNPGKSGLLAAARVSHLLPQPHPQDSCARFCGSQALRFFKYCQVILVPWTENLCPRSAAPLLQPRSPRARMDTRTRDHRSTGSGEATWQKSARSAAQWGFIHDMPTAAGPSVFSQESKFMPGRLFFPVMGTAGGTGTEGTRTTPRAEVLRRRP